MEKINLKQFGTSLLGALALSVIPAISPVSEKNVAEFQNPINPISSSLVQKACASGKCNCEVKIFGRPFKGKMVKSPGGKGQVCSLGC